MKLLFLLSCLCISGAGYACLNESHVNKSGKKTMGTFTLDGTSYHKKHNTADLETMLQNLQSKKEETGQNRFDTQNSIAVTLIKLGRLEEAETILNQLYKEKPEDYSIVANLGTLYELQGKNSKALEYIRRSVVINPDSHWGSEWFHIRVLEFKLRNLPDSQISRSDILHLGSLHKSAEQIAGEISYQLSERIPFTPAPNLLMAKILDEYAGFLADKISIKGAYLMYDIASDYDRSNVLQLREKKEALKPYFKKYKEKLPVTANHYLVPEAEKGLDAAMIASVLDKGISFLETQEQEKKEKEAQRKWLWGGGIALLLAGGGFAFYRQRKKAA
ncbi:MAG: hypothetical protein QM687_03680 [Ferruginibacter sp.]